MPPEKEYIIEFIMLGHSTKVTAFDPVTLTEASVIVPSGTDREESSRLAIRKLNYMLGKQQENE